MKLSKLYKPPAQWWHGGIDDCLASRVTFRPATPEMEVDDSMDEPNPPELVPVVSDGRVGIPIRDASKDRKGWLPYYSVEVVSGQ